VLAKNRKGQAAIEYLMILGIALTLSAPFVIEAQGTMLELRTGSQLVDLRSSVDKMEYSVKTVNSAGPPAKRTFFVDIPSLVVDAELVNDTRDSIVYRYNTSEGSSQISRSFDANLTGKLPEDSGRSRITVFATETAVNISVVE